MKKSIIYFLLIIGLSLSLSACKSSSNPAETVTFNSISNGNWRTSLESSNVEVISDSLQSSITLQEEDGFGRYTGMQAPLFQDRIIAINSTIIGNVTGVYLVRCINISLESSVTGDNYIYSWNLENVTTQVNGSASITALSKSHLFRNMFIYYKRVSVI